MLSAYEEERNRNIAANEKVLEQLGIEIRRPGSSSSSSKRQRSSTPRRELLPEMRPTRKSARTSGAAQTATLAAGATGASAPAARERLSDIPPWELAAFSECEAKSGAKRGTAVWDASKHHQHLTRSASGKAIATTGVAGYGAALARKVPGCKRWAVRAVRFGVGGFGVGVVKTSIRPPYKSIGKSPDAIGSYHSSGSFASHTAAGGERAFGPEYSPGDLVEVLLRPSPSGGKGAGGKAAKLSLHDVVYVLNGEEVGVAARGVAADSVVLAVQPYMGGVALLES